MSENCMFREQTVSLENVLSYLMFLENNFKS